MRPGQPPASTPAHPQSAPSAGGILLIGTPDTARFLDWAVEGVSAGARILGVLLAATPGAEPGRYFGPRPVLGILDDLPRLRGTLNPTTAVVCLPSGDSQRRAEAILRAAGLPARFVAPPDEWFTPEAAASASTPLPAIGPRIDLMDLVGRRPHGIDRAAVSRILAGKRVLITGAGGSIGSEIARICAAYGPAQLILMERAENALFEIDRQLRERFPSVARRAVLHDVVDPDATLRALVDLRPDVVFHTAAHKHVPLMEDHPAHALTNNFFGTKSIADAALAVGVERFVMISSDKAVNPTSVMGATKRLAEMYIQGLHRQGLHSGLAASFHGRGRDRTRFSMVRFGNVLGSACSVLPIWSAQLADGGPLTVTDARMTRYFMTINEAAALVIEAGAIDDEANSAAVYVLDMGEPVNILDLARRFVRAHGLEPRIISAAGGTSAPPPGTTEVAGPGGVSGPGIEIVLTGARPGEKLHEQLAYAAEQLRPTPYGGINAWGGHLVADFNLAAMVADLSAARISTDRAAVLAAIRRNVPEMVAGPAAEHMTTEQKPDPTAFARPAAA
ncbi:MAG: polysaccharide biosynthesis protein [Phycisphaerales bacterium]|nr:polysaccharide biosynthesis protein [Phycisphaerales bacterium]